MIRSSLNATDNNVTKETTMPMSIAPMLEKLRRESSRIKTKRITVVTIILLLTLGAVWFFTTGALDAKRHWFDETGISNGVGLCHYINTDRVILIDGIFDSATVSLQTAVRNATGSTPCASADRMIDVNIPALVGVTTETSFIEATLKSGHYRLLVAGGMGSESINLHVRE